VALEESLTPSDLSFPRNGAATGVYQHGGSWLNRNAASISADGDSSSGYGPQ
jgi:hypothetical protein